MLFRVLLATCLLTLSTLAAQADDTYPSRAVRVVVPQAAGGANDAIARVIAQKLSTVLNQPFVVENRPGAGGNIGTAAVAKARPDGYTLLLTANSMLVVNPALYRAPGFDPVKDFEPVALVATAGYLIAAKPGFQAGNIRELIGLARTNPGMRIQYGSAGNGTMNHLIGEMLNQAAKIELEHVPYKAAAMAASDVAGGQIPLAVLSVPASLGLVQGGKLKVLAVTNEKRIAALPAVPTVGETIPGFGVTPWYGIVAPAGTPKAIVERLRAAVAQVLDAKDVQEKLTGQGCEIHRGGPAEFAALIATDRTKWARIVRDAKVSLD